MTENSETKSSFADWRGLNLDEMDEDELNEVALKFAQTMPNHL